MKRIKHNKIKNTGILFELLTRQITVDVLNNDKKSQATEILKEFFNKKTQLGREYELYRILSTENYKSEAKANHLVDAVVTAHQKLNSSSLKREKYNFDFSANTEVFKQTTTDQKNYSSITYGKRPNPLSKIIDLNGKQTSDYHRENGNSNESDKETLWWKTFKQSNVHRSFTSKEYPM